MLYNFNYHIWYIVVFIKLGYNRVDSVIGIAYRGDITAEIKLQTKG